MHLTCIDTDESALEHLRAEAATGKPGDLDLTCVVYNAAQDDLFRAEPGSVRYAGHYLQLGLCDYIPDRYLVKILAGWRYRR